MQTAIHSFVSSFSRSPVNTGNPFRIELLRAARSSRRAAVRCMTPVSRPVVA